jgi:hypothetical protein
MTQVIKLPALNAALEEYAAVFQQMVTNDNDDGCCKIAFDVLEDLIRVLDFANQQGAELALVIETAPATPLEPTVLPPAPNFFMPPRLAPGSTEMPPLPREPQFAAAAMQASPTTPLLWLRGFQHELEVLQRLRKELAGCATEHREAVERGEDPGASALRSAEVVLFKMRAGLGLINEMYTEPLNWLLDDGIPELAAVYRLRRGLEGLVANYPEEQARNSADPTRKKDPGRTDRTAATMALRELRLFLDNTHMPREARRWLFAVREEFRELELHGRRGPILDRPPATGSPGLTKAAHLQNRFIAAAVRVHMDYDPDHGNKTVAPKEVGKLVSEFGLTAKVRGNSKTEGRLDRTIENIYEKYNETNAPDWIRAIYLRILSNVGATIKAGRSWKDCARDLVKMADRERAADAERKKVTKPAQARGARAPCRRDLKQYWMRTLYRDILSDLVKTVDPEHRHMLLDLVRTWDRERAADAERKKVTKAGRRDLKR